MNEELRDIHNRNKILAIICFCSVIFYIILNLLLNMPLNDLIRIFSVAIFNSTVIVILVWKKKFIKGIKYLVPLSLGSFSFLYIGAVPYITSYLAIYFIFALVSLYHDYKPIILTSVIGIAFTNYSYLYFYSKIFGEFSISQLVLLNSYIIMVGTALAGQSYFGQVLRKRVKDEHYKTIKAKDNILVLIEKIKESIQTLNAFSLDLDKRAELTISNMEIFEGDIQNVGINTKQNTKTAEESIESLKQLLVGTQNVALNTEKLMNIVNNTVDAAKEGTDGMKSTAIEINNSYLQIKKINNKMDILEKSSRDIETINETIINIAEQTNLLALNAAIEAARAGDAGKGFAVVADEIRKLAEQSSKSSIQITELIKKIQEEIKSTLETSESSSKNFKSLVENSNSTSEKVEVILSDSKIAFEAVEEISAATEEQAASSEEISNMTENLLEAIENISSTMENMSQRVKEQVKTFSEFKEFSSQLLIMGDELKNNIDMCSEG